MKQELEIITLGAKGDGVALVDGQEVFVPYTVPGERVVAEIAGDRGGMPTILEPVSDRVKAPCSHFRTCGGCATQHIAPEFLANWKRDLVIEALQKQGLGTEFRKTETSPAQSRRRAVFSGRRTKNGAQIGFHGRGSATFVPITRCSLVHPDIEAGMDGLCDLVKIAGTRKNEVRIGVTTSLGGLDVDVSDGKPMDTTIQMEIVKLVYKHGLARVFWNGEIVLERQPAQQTFGNALVTPPTGSFLQATKEGEAALLRSVKEIVGKAKSVADLFSGCGTFTLPLAENAEMVAYESSGPMLAALDKGWRQAKGLKRVETKTRDLFRNPLDASDLKPFDAVVLDPPRAGAREQTQHLAQSKVPKIAFVSCNPATFSRDARILVDGGYTLDWVQTVDQFLWSGHCELVAQFSRN